VNSVATYYDNEEGRRRLSQILCTTRSMSGISQEALAFELGVARKTIQNWEKGTTSPTFDQIIGWFRVVNISPLPYLFQYIYPDMENINSKDSDERLRKALITLIETLPMEGVRELLYLFYGDHGSSPRAVLNLLTAHLQSPMKDRVTQAGVIVKNYELALKKNNVTANEHIQPNIPLLKEALEKGENAFLSDSDIYFITHEK